MSDELNDLRRFAELRKISFKQCCDFAQTACVLGLTSIDNLGLCVVCGEECDGVEPDATEYECPSCGELAVYGAEWLLTATCV
jgi:hypothetical protein